MKNRFNRLTSKEWLPFQKSWFRFKGIHSLYEENIRFFCKAEKEGEVVYYYGKNPEVFKNVANKNEISVIENPDDNGRAVQFVLFDLLDTVTEKTTLKDYEKLKNTLIRQIEALYDSVLQRRFVAIFIKNIEAGNRYYPFAWDLARNIGTIMSLKDEKIGCLDIPGATSEIATTFRTDNSAFYALYFRKDENSDGIHKGRNIEFFHSNTAISGQRKFKEPMKSWFILKPQPRKKDEMLHPAKYPEDLADMFINWFTNENDNVFDPMSGTGSTQLGALRNKRNGYGTELSDFFTNIAVSRCEKFRNSSGSDNRQDFKILNIDAREIHRGLFPLMDYVITSPPYWDMLNMKGAENQALRKEKGLMVNYSDSDKDLGNIPDYGEFINNLVDIYTQVIELVKPGGYITIVVKNIKKKGKNYPFAWDLTQKLQQKLVLLPAVFWCQDDLSIAPYGYGNTWVSNTFHHYCLNFQKPL